MFKKVARYCKTSNINRIQLRLFSQKHEGVKDAAKAAGEPAGKKKFFYNGNQQNCNK